MLQQPLAAVENVRPDRVARGVCIVTDRRFLAYEGPAKGGLYTLLSAYDNVTPEEGLRLYHAHAPSTLKPDFNVK